jgi:uncharacterized membrane protein
MQINADAAEVYDLWRDFERWPLFMRHIDSIVREGPQRWRWKVHLPGLGALQWSAEMTEDDPGRRIGWRTLPGAVISHAGSVNFERLPGGRGTGIHVQMSYEPPAGAPGRVLASLLQPAPERLIRSDIRRLKSLLEAGEVAVNAMRPSDLEAKPARSSGNGGRR